jgi:hypothetical protein
MERRLPAKISRKSVKLCELCGTLNLNANKECWTCRWHGGFGQDETTIALAWQRLENMYEDVRVEHVTARRTFQLGDFGAIRPASFSQKLAPALAACWQRFLDQRDLRAAQRQARLHSRMPSPPDHLSI